MSSDMQWRSHYLFIIPIRAYRMLGLIRRVFLSCTDIYAKRCLYLSLVRSKLLYCSPVWRPQYLVDIRSLEIVQRRASKFIISNSSMNYRDRLISLEMLLLMMEYEIADIMFLIKSLKNPSSHFNILDFITFNISNTRSSSYLKLRHSVCKSNNITFQGHFYFHRIPRLRNLLPQIDTSLSIRSIGAQLRHHFWNHFIANFNSNNLCSYHYLCPCLNCSKLPIKMQFNYFM